MKKTTKNLNLLYMIFTVGLITANCIASKTFNLGITLFGAPVTITAGAICYPITFLVTDVIGELWGKEEANTAVRFGFLCQLLATAIIIVGQWLSPSSAEVQQAYVTLLGQNWVFVIASLTAYLCSQSWDVFIFHRIRERYVKTHGSVKGGKWIWNNASTMSSQLLDTIIHVSIAFGLGFGWFFKPEMHTMLLNMMVGQYLLKVTLAALDTPFFYLLTTESNKIEGH